MKTCNEKRTPKDLDKLCKLIRKLVEEGSYHDCIPVICQAMERHPHAPHPHNLLGIVLEKTGDHITAMKHFRAAWTLDPSYLPATHNLNTYGTFFSNGFCAFDDSDLPPPAPNETVIVYDERGVGRAVNKTKIQYDKRGVGHVIRR